MHIQKDHTSYLMEDICRRMQCVSEHVFSEHRPATYMEQMSDMVVVRMPGELDDQYVYQMSFVYIDLIARDKGGGIAPTKRLGEMSNLVLSQFPVVDSRYTLTRPKRIKMGQDEVGFTVWTIRAKLIVNTTDSYVEDRQGKP